MAAAENTVPPSSGGLVVWPEEDMLRLLLLTSAAGGAALTMACTALSQQLAEPVKLLRKSEMGEEGGMQALELQQSLRSLELAMEQADAHAAAGSSPASPAPPPTWQTAWEQLRSLEGSLQTEMRYVYGPDLEVKPGKLVSKKGTWLKKGTKFSWETPDAHKLYLPTGVVVPVLQIGQVADPVERKRHEWSSQHLRVWLKPAIIRSLEARRGVWFVYWPHFEDDGACIVATTDTWLKRSTQMSGELNPFELVYVPKGLPVRLARDPEIVDEQWEKFRHPHVHQHRKVTLASPPLTVKQDKYDVFIGQAEDRLHALRGRQR